MNDALSKLLRSGVLLSMGLVFIGLTFTFIHHPQYATSKRDLGELTSASATYPHAVDDVITQVRMQRGQAIVMLGLLLLIATPVARVAFSIVAFAIARDYLYVLITTVVLLLLIGSFALGAAG